MTDPRDSELRRPTERMPRADEPVVEEVVERDDDYRRVRTVRAVCAVIDIVCWTFAIVLLVHIFLVIGGANTGNGFFQFIAGWAGNITLGLDGLFTPDNASMATLLNEGLAAVLWLIIGALLTSLIARIALPSGHRRAWYRRSVRP
ncbi:hypothetical protein SAMN04488074_1213 [Lentzea albidocapillata subsp. violacea]|uniref:Uncharacterized protein n=1 Tax=Lentzea albidocapillata subsp. violacea TaxID=128104 RepID=A0A1G9SVZ8_9PSEU|nr:hypothetical protein [Lentzea albidocapillata]SDM39600.1 hypothetical protein SAMN04488074_1213 [Lentzea albidocapillata subsp. violacea]